VDDWRGNDGKPAEIAIHMFPDDGRIPNNPNIPVVVYRGVLDLNGADRAGMCIDRFAGNGWGRAWRNGIFPFVHFHSTAHESLGVCKGEARVRLGGITGIETIVRAGDALVLPAGTGHENLGSSSDLLVVGAYPDGPDFDLCRGEESERQVVLTNIVNVPPPESDPLFGLDGPLMRPHLVATGQ